MAGILTKHTTINIILEGECVNRIVAPAPILFVKYEDKELLIPLAIVYANIKHPIVS